MNGLLCLVGCCLSLGSNSFVLFILQPAQEESKDKVEMLEEDEGVGGHHIPTLHHLSPWLSGESPDHISSLKPEKLDKYCVPGTVSSLCLGL